MIVNIENPTHKDMIAYLGNLKQKYKLYNYSVEQVFLVQGQHTNIYIFLCERIVRKCRLVVNVTVSSIIKNKIPGYQSNEKYIRCLHTNL